MRVNREGYKIIINAAIFMILLMVLAFFFIPMVGLPIWCLWILGAIVLVFMFLIVRFFRDPDREWLKDEDFVYAPADGRVVVIEEVMESEFFHDKMIQVSVFMSIHNVHINWFPVGGKIIYKKVHDGKYLVAWHPKSSEENERVTTVVETNGGQRVMMRQVAGYVARRIVNYVEPHEYVEQNSRLGFIKFGSRVDIYLPLGTEILVGLEQRIMGSQTAIARFRAKE